MRSILSPLFTMVILTIPAAAWAQDPQWSININGETVNLVERGAVNPDAVWGFDPQAKEKIIFVCWENPTPAFAKQMEVVQRAVEASWQANSALRFLGWGTCADSSKGIRIVIKDDAADGPRVRDFGRKIDGLRNGMILNFTFRRWTPA